MKQLKYLLLATLILQGCSLTNFAVKNPESSSMQKTVGNKIFEIENIDTSLYEQLKLSDFQFSILLPKNTWGTIGYRGYDLSSIWEEAGEIVPPEQTFAFNIYYVFEETTKETILNDYCVINKYNETFKDHAEVLGQINNGKIEIWKVQPICEEYPIYFFWYKDKPYVVNAYPPTTEQGHQIILNALMHIQDM